MQMGLLTSNQEKVLLHSYVENVPSLFFNTTKNKKRKDINKMEVTLCNRKYN
jgi:hypothetical protein